MPSDQTFRFSISIVSHGHRHLVASLLDDLARLGRSDLDVILTWNLAHEDQALDTAWLPFRVTTIVNPVPQGFAANHNAAFQRSSGANFVILNPDIRVPADPFDALQEVLRAFPGAICAPLILNAEGDREDSARFFPSPLTLLKKAIAKACGVRMVVQRIPERGRLVAPEWIAGMFMVVPRFVYSALDGLSEKYFLYYEDVDFCARARLRGHDILVTQDTFAIHDARRESHRNPRFLAWHVASALRFFTSRPYLALKAQSSRTRRRA
jgi:N-acetylglucosaminyl-diphospho-decaprenol L-rhamnosyltransferase